MSRRPLALLAPGLKPGMPALRFSRTFLHGNVDAVTGGVVYQSLPVAACPIHLNQHSGARAAEKGSSKSKSVAWGCPLREHGMTAFAIRAARRAGEKLTPSLSPAFRCSGLAAGGQQP